MRSKSIYVIQLTFVGENTATTTSTLYRIQLLNDSRHTFWQYRSIDGAVSTKLSTVAGRTQTRLGLKQFVNMQNKQISTRFCGEGLLSDLCLVFFSKLYFKLRSYNVSYMTKFYDSESYICIRNIRYCMKLIDAMCLCVFRILNSVTIVQCYFVTVVIKRNCSLLYH